MLNNQKKVLSTHRRAICSLSILAVVAVGACSSSSNHSQPDASGVGSSSSSGGSSGCNDDLCTSYPQGGCGLTTGAAIPKPTTSCAMPGGPTMGPADTHCAAGGPDGGAIAQTVSTASCCANGDAGSAGCPYGATMYGMEGDDDDCKYHVIWTSTPICEGSPGPQFVVQAFYKTRFTDAGDPLPLTGANPETEVFTTTPTAGTDAATYCDDMGGNYGPTNANKNHLIEGPPGTYTGNVDFNSSGPWTVRFHVNEECYDVEPDSPHGHAAFHITVP